MKSWEPVNDVVADPNPFTKFTTRNSIPGVVGVYEPVIIIFCPIPAPIAFFEATISKSPKVGFKLLGSGLARILILVWLPPVLE